MLCLNNTQKEGSGRMTQLPLITSNRHFGEWYNRSSCNRVVDYTSNLCIQMLTCILHNKIREMKGGAPCMHADHHLGLGVAQIKSFFWGYSCTYRPWEAEVARLPLEVDIPWAGLRKIRTLRHPLGEVVMGTQLEVLHIPPPLLEAGMVPSALCIASLSLVLYNCMYKNTVSSASRQP